jgi:cysteine-S-conjugate beta-lyase
MIIQGCEKSSLIIEPVYRQVIIIEELNQHKGMRITMYDFRSFPDRRITESVKWGVYGKDVLPMWVADMDFVSPQPVIDALKERVEHGVFGYPMVSDELKTVVVERMATRYKWEITEDDLLFIPGVVPGFNLVCQALTGAGDSMIMQTPVYPPFLSAPGNAGIKGITVDLMQDKTGQYRIDFEAFEKAIQENTKVFLLCNPHNPVGRVYRLDELERLTEICLSHHITICSDEIHSDLIYGGYRHIPIASLNNEIEQNAVTLIAPSKTFNIAGLECSVLICRNQEMKKKIESARRGLLGGVNVLGLTAGFAAYKHGDEWLEEFLGVLQSNRDLLVKFVHENLKGIKMSIPEGTYLAWLDCRGLESIEDPYQFFLKEAKVALNDGAEFGEAGKGFLRMNFGCPESMLIEAMMRMKQALDKQ